MHGFRTADLTPADWVGAALSTPLTPFLLALISTAAYTAFVRPRPALRTVASEAAAHSVRKRYAPERRALAIAAVAVPTVFFVEYAVRGYVVDLGDAVSWWRFAVPAAASALALVVLASMIGLHGSASPEAPVVTGARRTWTAFGPRAGLVQFGVAFVLLIATTLGAGVTSSADEHGRYAWLEIPIPNEQAIDPIRLPYYGWAFGVPVLIALAALLVTVLITLEVNAARAFIRPETVAVERGLRAGIARSVVAMATAGMLLALAGAWRLVARAGSPTQLWINGQNNGKPYEAAWRYAELAAAGGWAAPILEFVAFTLFFLIIARLDAGRLRLSPAGPGREPVGAVRSGR